MALEMREFSQNIIRYINQSPLDIEFKRLAIKDVLAQIEKTAIEVISLELQNRKEQKKQEETEYNNEETKELGEAK